MGLLTSLRFQRSINYAILICVNMFKHVQFPTIIILRTLCAILSGLIKS